MTTSGHYVGAHDDLGCGAQGGEGRDRGGLAGRVVEVGRSGPCVGSVEWQSALPFQSSMTSTSGPRRLAPARSGESARGECWRDGPVDGAEAFDLWCG